MAMEQTQVLAAPPDGAANEEHLAISPEQALQLALLEAELARISAEAAGLAVTRLDTPRDVSPLGG